MKSQQGAQGMEEGGGGARHVRGPTARRMGPWGRGAWERVPKGARERTCCLLTCCRGAPAGRPGGGPSPGAGMGSDSQGISVPNLPQKTWKPSVLARWPASPCLIIRASSLSVILISPRLIASVTTTAKLVRSNDDVVHGVQVAYASQQRYNAAIVPGGGDGQARPGKEDRATEPLRAPSKPAAQTRQARHRRGLARAQ